MRVLASTRPMRRKSISVLMLGGRKFGEVTQANVGRPFAIVLDDKIISAPIIQTAILGGSGRITGNYSVEEANDLAILLRAVPCLRR